MAREISLFFHFIGFGLFITVNVAGIILHRQYKRATDLQQKGAILRASRPIGLISPIAILIQLLTGIGNMHALGYGFLDVGWLSAKLVIFVVAIVIGTVTGARARKRGEIVKSMLSGNASPDAEKTLQAIDRQIGISYIILPLLLMSILALSIYGRIGGQ